MALRLAALRADVVPDLLDVLQIEEPDEVLHRELGLADGLGRVGDEGDAHQNHEELFEV